jgi:hypothetical protein
MIVDQQGARPIYPDEGEGPTLELGDAVPGDGSWSPDGSTVAAALVTRDGFEAQTSLAVLDVPTGEVTDVPDSDGAQGSVPWTADGTAFA